MQDFQPSYQNLACLLRLCRKTLSITTVHEAILEVLYVSKKEQNILRKNNYCESSCEKLIFANFHTFDHSQILNSQKTFVADLKNLSGAVVRSEACSLGIQVARRSIPTSGTFFHGDVV